MNAMKATERTGPGGPGWLNNGQTVTIVGTTLTVAVAIGAMIFASTSAIRMELRTEIQRLDANMTQMRKELSADIDGVREELSADIKGLDGRLRVVEQTVAAISTRLAVTDTRVPGAGAPRDPAISGHGVAPGSGG